MHPICLMLPMLVFAAITHAADFQPAFEKVILPHEGGFQIIKSDNGNWTGCRVGKGSLKGTMGGISACAYPGEDIKNLTTERIAFLYRRDMWNKCHLGECSIQTVADRILDALVNNGPIAAIWVKKAVNRANGNHKDLMIGTRITSSDIDALNHCNQARFLLNFLGYRYMRYESLASQYPQFFDTWIDREVDEVITAVHDRDRLIQESSHAPAR